MADNTTAPISTPEQPKKKLPEKAIAIGGAVALVIAAAGGGWALKNHADQVAHDKSAVACATAFEQAGASAKALSAALSDASDLASELKAPIRLSPSLML